MDYTHITLFVIGIGIGMAFGYSLGNALSSMNRPTN